jgi:hypothetical protein
MMISEPQRAALLGQIGPLGEEAVRERARACARLFLGGCQSQRRSEELLDHSRALAQQS